MLVPDRFGWAALACLASLALSSCTTEDGPVYDVPHREQAWWLSLEIGKDGVPMILAQINMYYTTTAKLAEWEPLYNVINTQTVLYAKTSGAWKTQPFRNLSSQWGSNPIWAHNDKGTAQPLVWDRDRLNLYTGLGARWELKTRRTLSDRSPFWSMRDDATPLRITGDSGWHMVSHIYGSHGDLLVTDENGTSVRLDSGTTFYPINCIHGPDWMGAIGRQLSYSAQDPRPTLVWYRWNRDLKHPAPRKSILDTVSDTSSALIHQVQGETRLVVLTSADGLTEWALRGERFERLGNRPSPWPHADDETTPNRPGSAYYTIKADEQGCLHKLTLLFSRPDSSGTLYGENRTTTVHQSTCRPEIDTLDAGKLATGKNETVIRENIRIGPDGTLFLGAVIQEQKNDYPVGTNWNNQPVLPSRIGLATKRPGGKWEYETVASF